VNRPVPVALRQPRGQVARFPAGALPPLVLVAHGSRDPRAAQATRALGRAVAASAPGTPVRVAYLDHAGPRPGVVLDGLAAAGYDRAVVVPLLLTAAYHRRIDLPGAIAAARAEGLRTAVRIASVLGPPAGAVDGLLLAALRRRLGETWYASDQPPPRIEPGVGCTGAAPDGYDAVVLAAAGTRDEAARATVQRAADALSEVLGLPCAVGYASSGPPEVGTAVARLRAAGARRVVMAAYFLAPGLLYEVAVAAARDAGAVAVAPALTDAPELAELVVRRALDATEPHSSSLPVNPHSA
jgi:sirohydrochlorin ferrochelatase